MMESTFRFGVLSILLTLVAGIAWGIAFSRFVPELADVNPGWWFVLGLLLIARQIYKLFVR